MLNVITVKTMRESDAHTIQEYVPSLELMYRAAMGVYKAVDWTGKRVGIVTGSGNNGGDGYALACILADAGVTCAVFRVSDKFSQDGQHYHDLALSKGVTIVPFAEDTDLQGYDVLVDCMLGTGFSGQVKDAFRAAIKAINNAHKAYVVSVDINSGMNGDSGKAELAVKSDLTVTIGYLKSGLFLGDAIWYVGKIVVADIGIRLIRDDFFLAATDEIIFPNTNLELNGDRTEMLTPGEAEAQLKNGETIPELAVEMALKGEKLVRVLGRNSLVTDGYRTYFIEDGVFPEVISSLGEA